MSDRADGDVEMDGFSIAPNSPSIAPNIPSIAPNIPSIADNSQFNIPVNHSQFKGYYTEEYPGVAKTYGKGPTFIDKFDGDKHSAMWGTICIALGHLN